MLLSLVTLAEQCVFMIVVYSETFLQRQITQKTKHLKYDLILTL